MDDSEADSRGARSGPRSRAMWIVLGALLGVMVGIVVITDQRDTPSAKAVVARLATFLRSAASYRYDATITRWDGLDDGDDGKGPGAGSTTIERTLISGSAAPPHAWRESIDEGESVVERVRMGPSIYERSAPDQAQLHASRWIETSVHYPPGWADQFLDDDIAYRTFMTSYMAVFSPAVIVQLASQMEHPVIVSREGRGQAGVAVRSDLEIPGLGLDKEDPDKGDDDDLEREAPTTASVLVDLDEHQLPRRIALTVEGAKRRAEMVVTFVSWNELVDIALPEPDVIEATPWLDEGTLAIVRTLIEPRAPSEPPANMELRAVAAFTAEESDAGCPELRLDYAAPPAQPGDVADVGEVDYFDVRIWPRSCAEDRGVDIDLAHRDTAIGFDTTLPAHQLAAAMRSMAPFDVDQAVADVAATMAEQWGRSEASEPGGYVRWLRHEPTD